jgi:hypothetical protein
MSRALSHHSRSSGVADDIDFEVKGQELQFVEIELDPGRARWRKPARSSGRTPRSR